MKRFGVVFLFLGVFFQGFASSSLEPILASGELVIVVPSHGYLVNSLRFLYSHFYGANFTQKWAELSAQSKAGYGVDVLDPGSLASIGIQTNAPMAFVHVEADRGYLALPLANQKTFEVYLKKNLPQTAFRFVSNYVLLSQNEGVFAALSNRLLKTDAFVMSEAKLPGLWSNGWIWFESRYLSSITRGTGVSDRVNLPLGFGLVNVIFSQKSLLLRMYTAAIDKSQQELLYQLQRFENNPRFQVLDFVRGNPLLLGQVSLNISQLYRYYRAVDKLDILGIGQMVVSLRRDYGVDMERDLIHNSEGRLVLIVDRYQNNQFLYYGSIGIKNTTLAKNLMESLKNMVLQKGDQLYAFEVFTIPFYHYKMTNSSFYFGLVDNEFFFASDKDLLVQCIKDIYEKKSGNPQPPFFMNPKQRTGMQLKVDVQTLLASFAQDSGIRLAREFFVGMESIEMESYPDTTTPAYGWSTEVRLNFYK
ncbi:hypothetical protein [Thermospira aquatica]|uniref:DUF3352 domain-containing protein n=1 Tax=Thermospira aquatica TaxID=2828656 RepID=A0AAX3BG29_9SPIR|nr:hypothetical protein [Thermospira aquatica]URA11297.1 hypothetical protein KDW03_05735 [Thermospira aquatica]